MRRVVSATCMVCALVFGITSTPTSGTAHAAAGGTVPINYGDCVSFIATGGSFNLPFGQFNTVQEFNAAFYPYESQGHQSGYGAVCGGFPPGKQF